MAKTTAAMRRKRSALAVPDVGVPRPPYSMADISPDAVVGAFSGNGLSTARAQGLPVRVVYCAVKLVAAERDWLLSLQVAGEISELQLERLFVLRGLLGLPGSECQLAAASRTVEKTQLEPGHPRPRVRADAPGKGGSSS